MRYPTTARVSGIACVYLIFWNISLKESIVSILYLADESILKELCWVSSPRGFPRINLCVYCEWLSFSDSDVVNMLMN